MSLRIAFLIPTLYPGGAERQLINTVRALTQHDVEIRLFVLRDIDSLSQLLPPKVKMEMIGMKGGGDLKGYGKLFSRLKAFKPDVLHSQLYPGNLLARVFRLIHPRTKVVNHIHGLGGWMKPWHVLGERLTGRLAHRILTVSEKSYNIRRKREGFSTKRLSVLYNAIATDRFDTDQVPSPPPLILGMAARLIRLKRVDRVISLLGELRKRGLDVQLRIAGDGPERESLDAIVAAQNLGNHVEFIGHVTDMAAFYPSIHILCLASETEDLPMVLIEAMAAGRPVIASDVGGVSELTRGGEGFLVEDWEAKDLPDCVAEFIQNIDWRACWSNNRRFAQEGFDEKAYAEKLMKMYGDLLE